MVVQARGYTKAVQRDGSQRKPWAKCGKEWQLEGGRWF